MVEENVQRIQARMEAAAKRAGRDPGGVRLVAVTKGVPVERIREALACGVREIGENRVQEALAKKPLVEGARWHLIGHLQRNKAKLAVEMFDLIHSVDSLELVEALERQAEGSRGPGVGPLELLIQVNVSGEAVKHGCHPEQAESLAGAVLESKTLRLTGLMTMAPFEEDPEKVRPVFRQLRILRDRLEGSLPCKPLGLSMGMSRDFEAAIDEGATLVRIGTAIFGES